MKRVIHMFKLMYSQYALTQNNTGKYPWIKLRVLPVFPEIMETSPRRSSRKCIVPDKKSVFPHFFWFGFFSVFSQNSPRYVPFLKKKKEKENITFP